MRVISSILALCILASSLLLVACNRVSELEKVQKSGVLRVVTRNNPTTYYQDRTGPTGFEYELATLFAKNLGVELEIMTSSSLSEIFSAIHAPNQASFAAAGLTVTEERKKAIRFTTPNFEVTQKLIYHADYKKPRSIDDLKDKKILVIANSSHAEQLRQIQPTHQDLVWEETQDLDPVDLVKMVQEHTIDFTVMDSNEFDIYQAYFPKLRAAFSLSEPQQLAWAFPRSQDNSLYDKAQDFFKKIEADGTLLQLKERFYGHMDQLNYVGARTFIWHVQKRLPKYAPVFKEKAEEKAMDWRLLAAVGYQESHWNPRAVSPTGVRGLMMLTHVTAKEMGVKNRLDPIQSISGGASYLQRTKARIPKDIQEPDRTWFALASYNVGFGHLEDARIITEQQGGDPDRWIDVKERLPLLQNKKWYKNTKYGYARGYEPVLYVQNIRRYYDVLTWITQPEEATTPLEEHEFAFPEVFNFVPPVL